MSRDARKELTEIVAKRYQEASGKDRSTILDEFEAVSGYHRKHALRLLNSQSTEGEKERCPGQRIYDDAVREALIVLWETADRICSKRLKAAIPKLVESMERHGHLELDSEVRQRLMAVSPATIDRLLASTREEAQGTKRRRRSSNVGIRRRIPVRTFADFDDPPPGFFEADFVLHCGGSLIGSFVHSFVVTDVASGWTEGLPLIVREQSLVVEALDVLRERLPIEMLGLDTDNDGAFINETLLSYCESQGIEFTRSRPYRKNDQAWIEQKNGSVIRRLIGHGRLEGFPAAKMLVRLYDVARLYVNFFQPSFKLLEKRREGSKVIKQFYPPATPCDRLIADERVAREIKEKLEVQQRQLDPVALLRELRAIQTELAVLQNTIESEDAEVSEDTKKFLENLPTLWKQGEARPTHRKKPSKPRHWRTRVDPFEQVWSDVESWLEADPDVTGKTLLERLQKEHPGKFTWGQLRTLQRRVRSWRQSMARALLFSSSHLSDSVHDESSEQELGETLSVPSS